MKNELSCTRLQADFDWMDASDQHNLASGWQPQLPAVPAAVAPARTRRPAGDRRLAYLLLVAWIINLFDLCLTVLAWRQHLMVELNPLAAKVLPHGTAAIIIYKIGLLVIGTTALWYCRRHWATEPAVWAYVILCIGLSFWWHSLVNEMHLSWAEFNPPAHLQPLPPEIPGQS